MNHSVHFDIESGPLPTSEILPLAPEFEAPANYKNPELIAASIEKQKQEWLDRAALSPVTGQVLAIGYEFGDVVTLHFNDDEAVLLNDFWALLVARTGHPFVGFNIFRFDLLFLVRRSWKHGIKLPEQVRNGRYWGTQFIDLMEVWQLGNRDQTISLDNLARFMGIGEKNTSGADFYKMTRAEQEKHLTTDLTLTATLAKRML